jgi:hypothetical protein
VSQPAGEPGAPPSPGYLEGGEDNPSLHLALRIAELFDVPVEVVFSTDPFPRPRDRVHPA